MTSAKDLAAWVAADRILTAISTMANAAAAGAIAGAECADLYDREYTAHLASILEAERDAMAVTVGRLGYRVAATAGASADGATIPPSSPSKGAQRATRGAETP